MAARKSRSQAPQPRFEATIHPGAGDTPLARAAELSLDRLPDPRGEVRLLVNAEEIAELLGRGYEVRLHAVVPVVPLAAELIADDAEVVRWLEDQVAGIPRAEGS